MAPRGAVEMLEVRRLLATFVVTSTADDGGGSLRQAILDANASPGADAVHFSIVTGPQTIALSSDFPIISDPLTLDATTQPGFAGEPLITIQGNSLLEEGLVIEATATTVRGLKVQGFGGNGIEINFFGGNVVEGNHLLGNTGDGIAVNSSNNRIGGTTAATRNVISGNAANGIDTGASSGNVIQGNYIGTNPAGTTAMGNALFGVRVSEASANTIGGTGAGAGNLIGGNGSDGVRITALSGGGNNIVAGNLIGTSAAGNTALANGGNGVTIFTAGNMIGGSAAGRANVISGNTGHGVAVSGSAAIGNMIQGNRIGTDLTGSFALPNGGALQGRSGVLVVSASGNLIGGTEIGAGNLISGNSDNGVLIEGGAASHSNRVEGNRIGTNATGSLAVPNTDDGVHVRAAGNTIGGTAPGAGNLISGNGDDGVEIQTAAAVANVLAGNRIGTDVTGTAALGNQSDGVEIQGGVDTVIGGTDPAAANVLSGNASDGIEILDDITGAATGNIIRGNFIGTTSAGADLGNQGHGVQVKSGGSTMIGDAAAGSGNRIAFNGLDGVYVASGTGHRIVGNSVYSNGGLGIDLGVDGVTPNDPEDADAGANQLQNFPVLGSATTDGSSTSFQGSLASTPAAAFRIDLYASPAADPSGFGEGRTYLGSFQVNTDAAGQATFAQALPIGVTPGAAITATATDASGNTSEFSSTIAAGGADTVPPIVSNATFAYETTPRRLVVTFSEDVSASLALADVAVRRSNGDLVNPAAMSYNAADNTATFSFAGDPPDSNYTATLLSSGITDASGNALDGDANGSPGGDYTFAFFFLQGDANRDGVVNLLDFNVLAANFNQSPRTFSQGDFSGDGTVNLLDFNILAARFNQTVQALFA